MNKKLRNSNREQPEDAVLLAEIPDANEVLQVTVVIRPQQTKGNRNASAADLQLVADFAGAHGLKVVESSSIKRCVVLSGTVAQFAKAFQTKFTLHQHQKQKYRSFRGGIRVPEKLGDVVTAVLGLEDRPLMAPHAFLHSHRAQQHVDPKNVMKAYDFPGTATGKNQYIAIIELGGGFHQSDIAEYFRLQQTKAPQITIQEIQGQRNDPAPPDHIRKMLDAMGRSPEAKASAADTLDHDDAIRALWTIESTLDVELAGSFANDACIVVYFAPNNAQGKYHALTSALHSKDFPPSLISCSWGAIEEDLPADFVQSFDQVLQDAAGKGVTVCYSSGDRGEDPGKNGQPRVHFPASSPHVLSCGGTHWVDPEIPVKEVVWSEQLPTALAQSGGGTSRVFPLPDWQAVADVKSKTGINGRGVPDVAGKADMAAGYEMVVGGFKATMGGTSSAAPMWSGLIACLNQELGHNIGWITPLLYQEEFRDGFRDITEGSTGKRFKAGPGWDPCTGWGTPNGVKLLAALKARKPK